MSVQNIYKRMGPIYNYVYSDWLFGDARAQAVGLVSQRQSLRILEVGVGTGLTLPLYDASSQVTGVDVSDSMLRKSRELISIVGLNNCEVKLMDATSLEFPDNTFDAVLGNLFLSATQQPNQCINEIVRVCKGGGRIVFMNHFKSKNRLLALLERMINPITKELIGFHSALDLQTITSHKNLELVHQASAKPFGYWTTVAFVNRKDL